MADMARKGRALKPMLIGKSQNAGEANGQATLTDDQVRGIRPIAGFGISQRKVGLLYRVRQQHVSRIVRGVRRMAA